MQRIRLAGPLFLERGDRLRDPYPGPGAVPVAIAHERVSAPGRNEHGFAVKMFQQDICRAPDIEMRHGCTQSDMKFGYPNRPKMALPGNIAALPRALAALRRRPFCTWLSVKMTLNDVGAFLPDHAQPSVREQ